MAGQDVAVRGLRVEGEVIVRLRVTQKVEQDFDVAFPIYRRHDVGEEESSVIYHRVTFSDGKFHEAKVLIGGSTPEATVSIRHYERFPSHDEPDYLLGRGFFKSSPAEFTQAVADAKEILSQIESLAI